MGQVELDIADAADTTVVVVNPGWGDGVQANKAGLLEVADVFVVNKADRAGADAAVKDLVAMLDFGPHMSWTPPIVETVATTGEGDRPPVGRGHGAPRSPRRDRTLGTTTAGASAQRDPRDGEGARPSDGRGVRPMVRASTRSWRSTTRGVFDPQSVAE